MFDIEQKQVRKRGRRYRGCDGTYIGVMGRTRPAEDKLFYLAGRIIILSEDSPDIG